MNKQNKSKIGNNQSLQVVVDIRSYKRKKRSVSQKPVLQKERFLIAPGMKNFLEALVEKMVLDDMKNNIKTK